MQLKNKKAQLKIQQMAMMLVALTLFFMLVFLFFISIKMASINKQAEELNRDEAVALVTKIASSPEFNFAGSSRGIDANKVLILKEKKEYRNFWGIDGIIIEKIYPDYSGDDGENDKEDIECTKENYPECNKISLFTRGDGEFVHSYVSLCRKELLEGNIYDKCEMAILQVGIKQLKDDE